MAQGAASPALTTLASKPSSVHALPAIVSQQRLQHVRAVALRQIITNFVCALVLFALCSSVDLPEWRVFLILGNFAAVLLFVVTVVSILRFVCFGFHVGAGQEHVERPAHALQKADSIGSGRVGAAPLVPATPSPPRPLALSRRRSAVHAKQSPAASHWFLPHSASASSVRLATHQRTFSPDTTAFTHKQQLEGYFKRSKSALPQEPIDEQYMSSLYSPCPLKKYIPSVRSSGEVCTSASGVARRNKSIFFDEYLTTKGISESDLDKWTENIRKWLAHTVLHPLVASPEFRFMCERGSSCNFNLAGMPSTPNQPVRPQYLQRYLSVLGCTSDHNKQLMTEYLVHRIQALAEGSFLKNFIWNGGAQLHGKQWNQDLPTDSQIIAHLFCTRMDELLATFPNDDKPFSSRHFIVYPNTPDPHNETAVIYQEHIHPPHFEVAVKGERWPIQSGTNNLFFTFVLFFWCIYKDFHGYLGLGLAPLSSPVLGISDIFNGRF